MVAVDNRILWGETADGDAMLYARQRPIDAVAHLGVLRNRGNRHSFNEFWIKNTERIHREKRYGFLLSNHHPQKGGAEEARPVAVAGAQPIRFAIAAATVFERRTIVAKGGTFDPDAIVRF